MNTDTNATASSATSPISRPRAVFNTNLKRWKTVFTPDIVDGLQKRVQIDPTVPAEMTEDFLVESIAGAEVAITTWAATPFTPKVLDACPDLKIVIHAAGSVKCFVTPELVERGVTVCSGAHVNARPVAEFCLGMIFMALKDIPRLNALLESEGPQGWWGMKETVDGGYYRTKIGLIGFGQISKALLKLLQPFDFDVYLASGYVTAADEKEYGFKKAEIDWIMAHSDLVSLHSADVEKNWNQINAQNLATMKKGARLINTARGRLVDEAALVEKLKTGDIWAYLDVTHPEPPAADHPFLSLPNCILTPHISGTISHERARLGAYALRELENYLAGRPLESPVDLSNLDSIA